ncbi:MAG: DUF2339 domain-containing protein [Oscillospiraceae bacterium]|nr:DUF2339 domain-containing protein [Oscillospiraceae bacterium]
MNYPNNPNNQNNVSGKELFVGLNVLSKIGVIFLILGVIAFSAASKGYIPEWVRLTLVFAVGVIMLVVGELFYRKGSSKIFSLALIYGGMAELFISSLIGYYGFPVFGEFAVLGTFLGASIVGFALSERYRSQFLSVLTVIASIIPFFMFYVKHGFVYFFAAAIIMGVHCANAVIARKKRYNVSFVTGIILLITQVPMLCDLLKQNLNFNERELWTIQLFPVIFAAFGAFIYTAGAILNAIQNGGKASELDLTGAAITQVVAMMYSWNYIGGIADGIVMFVLAIFYALAAACFILRFGGKMELRAAAAKSAARGKNNFANLLLNLALIAAVSGIFLSMRAGYIRYIALHLFAAAIFTMGAFFESKLPRVWGVALLVLSEVMFRSLYARYEGIGMKLFITIVNIVIWLAILIPFVARKKHNATLFRIYTALAVFNAGFLGASVIVTNVVPALEVFSIWEDKAGQAAFAAMCAAVLWMLVGFIFGKLKYMKTAGIVLSIISYVIGLLYLMGSSIAGAASRNYGNSAGLVMIIVTIIINAVSVLAVLDITLQIRERAPRFAKAVGLVVSGYALIVLTSVLGTNDFVKFTSFIISIIYIVTAALWIVIGFKRKNTILRRFGLALALLSSTKLFLFDFRGINPMGKTLLFIGFALTLLGISYGYGIAEKSLKK